MPLTPPPDHSITYRILAVGLCSCCAIYAATRSTLPHTGDNLHSLPYGGKYSDGTKSICYSGPGPTPDIPTHLPALLVLVLVIAIYASSRLDFSVNYRCSCRVHNRPGQ
uniref:Strawberry mild yellow edge-associated potexvirus coat protein, partial replicase and ORF2, ORF3, ORF4 n=1 Tax=Strawberry mild yellow edge-associated virus TaxID=12187 RepID=O41278_SMYEA|nr:unnamed protein product [Strawberry mild yellow edge virus]